MKQGDGLLENEGALLNQPPSPVISADIPVYGGYVIGRDEKVVFIRGAIPGELVEIAVEEKKRDYSIASVTNVIEPSPFRRQPPCGIFGICGGCQLQHIQYEKQLSPPPLPGNSLLLLLPLSPVCKTLFFPCRTP